MTHGVDISEWQGRIDWPIVAPNVDFAIVRAGYGLAHPDPLFSVNIAGTGGARIPRAAYLWFRASQDPVAQADYLAGAAAGLELAPWCDFETTDGNSRPALALLSFLIELEHRDGRTPTLYTGPAFWRSVAASDIGPFSRYPLAIAHYTNKPAPDVPPPWATWAYWQHTSAGRVPGIAGLVDLDLSVVRLLSTTDPKEHPMAQLAAPIVAVVADPSTPGGYWQVGADAGIFNYGGAIGLEHNFAPAAPITDAAVTATGKGMWLTDAAGDIYALGDAPFHGHAPDPN